MDLISIERRYIAALFIPLLLLLVPVSAFSSTSTTTFNVTANIDPTCSVSVSTLSFGNYNPLLSANLDMNTTLVVTCTTNSSYTIGLDAGAGTGATVASRLMTRLSGGTDTVAYTLYQDSSHSTVWGTTGAATVSGTGTGAAQNITIYGRIFSTNPTTTPPASYSDTITATVTY